MRELTEEGIDHENFNPHSLEFIRDPYSTYRWFRQNKPVSLVEHGYDSYWVYRHADIQQLLSESDLWIKEDLSESGVKKALGSKLTKSLFASDNPRHDELRSLMGPIFMAATANVEAYAQETAESLIQELQEKSSIDLIQDFALPLPSRTLAHVLGIPQFEWSLITPLVHDVLQANDPSSGKFSHVRGAAAMLALRAGFKGFLDYSTPGTEGQMLDLMVKLAHSPDNSFTISDAAANAASMSIAGYFSTTMVLGTGISNLLSNPVALSAVKAEIANNGGEAMMSSVVAEMLRFDTPIQLVDRFAAEDTQLAGVPIRRGQKVSAVVGSANRDEEVFPQQDHFDINRNTDKLLSFGDGMHRCLGEQMLNKVAPAGLKAILSIISSYQIASAPEWQTDPNFRGLRSIDLEPLG